MDSSLECRSDSTETSSATLDYFEWCASFLTAQVTPTTWSDDDELTTPSPTPSPSPSASLSSSSPSPSSSPERAQLTPSYISQAQFTYISGAPYMYPNHQPFQSPFQRSQPPPPPPQLHQQQQQHHQEFKQYFQQIQSFKRENPSIKEEAVEETVKSPASAKIIERLPEFLYATPDLSGLSRADLDSSCFTFNYPFHRNCYEVIRLKLPAVTAQHPTDYDGYRLYIHSNLGYSGNAKRFKHAPDAGERAFVLSGQVLNNNMQPITQCQTCEEYFKDSQKWILLIKNNLPMYVEKGEFSLQLKMMCCSTHHNSNFYFRLSLLDVYQNKMVLHSLFAATVKQWKNMSSASSAVSTPVKRRKSGPT